MNVEDLLHPLLNSYLKSPQWVKASVGRAYSAVPVSWRRGRNYQRFLTEASLQVEPALRQLASRKLARTLRHVLQMVPAYRGLRDLTAELGDIEGADQQSDPVAVLRQLPVISKEDVKSHLDEFLAVGVDPALRMKMFTGGSTSVPMTLYLHKGVTRAKEYAFIEQFHQRAGMHEHDTVLALRGQAVPGADAGGPLWMMEPIKKQLIFSPDHLNPPFMPEYLRAMRRWKPRFIQAYPSAAYQLALWLRDNPDHEVTQRIESIMLFSENVPERDMALFRNVFGCPVLKHYGHSERLAMASTMPDDDRYFFWPQYGYIELVDAAGQVIEKPGELGEIVATGFDNDVMPLVRYRTGDMAVWSDRPHPRLPGFPAVERIEGRIQEFIVCEGDRLVGMNAITTAEQHALLEFAQSIQFEQREAGRLLMRVVMPRRLSADELRDIARSIEQRTGRGCHVEAQQVDAITRTARGKTLMLVQHLDMRRYFGEAIAS